MNVRCAIETFSEYSTQQKTDFLLQLAHTLTILARDTDEVGQKRLINLSAEKKKDEKLMQAARLRLINEVHHRVISFNEEKRYPDEKFVRSILEPPGDLELQRQLREAFDLMVQMFASVSKVGAAPPPEVVVHCVHGTFPRGWWRQQLWNAGYPFRWLCAWGKPCTPAFPRPKKRFWFEPDSDLEKAVLKKLKGLGSDSDRVRFERFLWSGSNSFSARKKAAQELRWYLAAWRRAFPGVQHLILAHSHGGTVAVTAVHTPDKLAEQPAGRGCEPLPRVKAVDRTDKLADGMMTLGTPFVRLASRGPKENPSKLQEAVSMSLPTIFLVGAPVLAVLLAVVVLLRGTAGSTTMWGWALPVLAFLAFLGFLALVRRHVALAAFVLVMAYVVGGYVIIELVLLSWILIVFAYWLNPKLRLPDKRDLVEDEALCLPCPLVAVRTPGDEASLVIGLGQGLERVFHLAAGAIGALGERFKPLYDWLAGRPWWFSYVLVALVPVLYPLIGAVLVVMFDWVLGNPGRPLSEVLVRALGSQGRAVNFVSITLFLLSALPGLALSLFTGREALALPAITGVDAEPLPFAEPECRMTLVIDVEAGREKPKGLTHSLHEVSAIRSRIACWIHRAILHPMNTVIDP